MSQPQKIVLDTSIFVNPDGGRFFGPGPLAALENFLTAASSNTHLSFYMPPAVWQELLKFIENEPAPQRANIIVKQPPASYQDSIPAMFMYEFIEEMRGRINKGLRVAEKFAHKALLGEKEDLLIKSLREEHRVAMREGVIDSREDFDLLLLAKELGASLATCDQGLVKWAHKLGIACLDAKGLKACLTGRQACLE